MLPKRPNKKGEISNFFDVPGSKFKIFPFFVGTKFIGSKFTPFSPVKIWNSPPFGSKEIHPFSSGQNSKFTPFYQVKIQNSPPFYQVKTCWNSLFSELYKFTNLWLAYYCVQSLDNVRLCFGSKRIMCNLQENWWTRGPKKVRQTNPRAEANVQLHLGIFCHGTMANGGCHFWPHLGDWYYLCLSFSCLLSNPLHFIFFLERKTRLESGSQILQYKQITD